MVRRAIIQAVHNLIEKKQHVWFIIYRHAQQHSHTAARSREIEMPAATAMLAQTVWAFGLLQHACSTRCALRMVPSNLILVIQALQATHKQALHSAVRTNSTSTAVHFSTPSRGKCLTSEPAQTSHIPEALVAAAVTVLKFACRHVMLGFTGTRYRGVRVYHTTERLPNTTLCTVKRRTKNGVCTSKKLF